jgi:hypothetical protein
MNPGRLILPALIVVAAAGGTHAADVAFFGILKTQQFLQTNAAAPAPLATQGFAFNTLVLASGNNLVTNATVKPSNSTPLRQLISDSSQALWTFEERFNSQAALDAVYPNGNIIQPVNYAVAMSTVNDGAKTVNLNFVAAALLGTPPTPQLNALAEAQSIDHTLDFTLRWTANGSALDVVQVLVFDAVSNLVAASPAPFTGGALNGTSNTFTLAAFTLPPGETLVGHITLARPGLPNTNSYAGAIGVPALVKDTQFPLVTRPAPPRPTVSVRSIQAAPFRGGVTGESNRRYHVEATVDFVSWTLLLTTNPATGTFEFADPAGPMAPGRFYRARIGP